MKLGIISDLHYDLHPEGKNMPEILTELSEEKGIQTLLIAGDISGYIGDTDRFLTELEERLSALKNPVRLLFCLGNHDLWNRDEPGLTVNEVFRRAEKHPGFLQNRLVPLTEKTVLVAGVGWWDYTLADRTRFTYEELSSGKFNGHDWKSTKWTIHDAASDPELAARWNRELLALIRSVPDKDVVFMTHMIQHPAFLVPKDHPAYEPLFTFFNGLLGNEELFRIAKEPNVKVSVSGHVHFRNSFTEDGIYFTCPNVGGPGEFLFRTPDELLSEGPREARKELLRKEASPHPAKISKALAGQKETEAILRFQLADALDVVEVQ